MDLCLLSYQMRSSLNCSYNASFDDLPDGLIVDILLRLPVKTLVQSTCVCKLWFSIIKSTSFVSSHLSRSISHRSCYNYIYLFGKNPPSMAVISDNHLLTCHPDFKFPFETQSTDLKLIGACNGLVCVTEDSSLRMRYGIIRKGHDIYMINPSIHKYKKLGVESSCYADWIGNFGHIPIGTKVGFGYCDVENDYKIVRIFNRYPSDYSLDVLESKVEIYSLKSGKWRALDVSNELISSNCSLIFLHGCLYWTTCTCLVCFDLKDEVFSKIEYSTATSKNYFRLHNIVVKNDSIVEIKYKLYDNDLGNVCLRLCLFVLENDFDGQVQWKEFCYDCPYLNFLNVGKCIGFSGVGRLLFLEKDWDSQTDYIVAVDLDNLCAIEKLPLDFNGNFDLATNVLESLVLLLD